MRETCMTEAQPAQIQTQQLRGPKWVCRTSCQSMECPLTVYKGSRFYCQLPRGVPDLRPPTQLGERQRETMPWHLSPGSSLAGWVTSYVKRWPTPTSLLDHTSNFWLLVCLQPSCHVKALRGLNQTQLRQCQLECATGSTMPNGSMWPKGMGDTWMTQLYHSCMSAVLLGWVGCLWVQTGLVACFPVQFKQIHD